MQFLQVLKIQSPLPPSHTHISLHSIIHNYSLSIFLQSLSSLNTHDHSKPLTAPCSNIWSHVACMSLGRFLLCLYQSFWLVQSRVRLLMLLWPRNAPSHHVNCPIFILLLTFILKPAQELFHVERQVGGDSLSPRGGRSLSSSTAPA